MGSGDGLLPNRLQASALTNEDSVHYCIYVAPGLDEWQKKKKKKFTKLKL